jgi:phospholipid/cholesterol/gamma-HCH transport system substrate-binding protein
MSRLRALRRLPSSSWKFAVFAVVCVVLLVVLAVHVGNLSLFSSRRTVYAQLAQATGLSAGTAVDVAGVQVGQVSSVAVQHGHALVGLSLDNDVPVRSGTDVGLRWKNVIGQKDVYLYPSGRGRVLPAGATIPLSHDVTDASVNAFLNTLGPLLQSINPAEANAFVENVSGAINGDTAEIDQLVDSGATISQTVGSLDTQVGNVIASLDQVLTAIAERSSDVGSLVDNLQTVASALASRNSLLDSVVGNLSTVAGDLADLIGQNRSTIDTTIADLNTATATIVAHQDQLAQSLVTLGSGLAPYVEISSYGQWFQVQTVYNCLAGQTVCSYQAPTTPPAGSGPGGSPPLTLGSSGTVPSAKALTPGGTGTGGPSTIPAVLGTVVGSGSSTPPSPSTRSASSGAGGGS